MYFKKGELLFGGRIDKPAYCTRDDQLPSIFQHHQRGLSPRKPTPQELMRHVRANPKYRQRKYTHQ
jgi:hypothetical protein